MKKSDGPSRRWLAGFGLLASALLISVAYAGADAWLFNLLQNRFPLPTALQKVDGVVILGGGGPGRIGALMDLVPRFPRARVVLSGADVTEIRAVRNLLLRAGADPNRLVIDARARNTYENALFSYQEVGPKPDEIWLVVTSAYHMPRAVGCFRALKWAVVPYPVDFRHPTYGLTLHEWIGLVSYYLIGRSAALLPGP